MPDTSLTKSIGPLIRYKQQASKCGFRAFSLVLLHLLSLVCLMFKARTLWVYGLYTQNPTSTGGFHTQGQDPMDSWALCPKVTTHNISADKLHTQGLSSLANGFYVQKATTQLSRPMGYIPEA